MSVDVSTDGAVVVGSSYSQILAHDTATGEVLWEASMPRNVGVKHFLRIHRNMVFLPCDSEIVVLDLKTGLRVHSLPSAGSNLCAIFVFDGSYVLKVECVTQVK